MRLKEMEVARAGRYIRIRLPEYSHRLVSGMFNRGRPTYITPEDAKHLITPLEARNLITALEELLGRS